MNNKSGSKAKFKKATKIPAMVLTVPVDEEPSGLTVMEAEEILGCRISLD